MFNMCFFINKALNYIKIKFYIFTFSCCKATKKQTVIANIPYLSVLSPR